MIKHFKLFGLALFAMISATPAHAGSIMPQDEGCPVAQAPADSNLIFRQYKFPDGSWDLAILDVKNLQHIKRVTYGGGKADVCYYHALAIAKGGEWGWHLAWADSSGVHYARMDGNAWVSSPPKRLTTAWVEKLEMTGHEEFLSISWREPSNGKRRTLESNDEGRNWGLPQ